MEAEEVVKENWWWRRRGRRWRRKVGGWRCSGGNRGNLDVEKAVDVKWRGRRR